MIGEYRLCYADAPQSGVTNTDVTQECGAVAEAYGVQLESISDEAGVRVVAVSFYLT